MKNYKILIVGLLMGAFVACDVDYENDPNSITQPPTSGLYNDAAKKMVDDFYDQWFSGRFTQVTVQYWTQSEYADEDRYAYRESQRETWEDFYRNLENLRKVLTLNTDEATRDLNSAYGDNDNQIAIARIMMAWTFNIMTDTWGDIPYYAYGSTDPDFQALQVADTESEILSPKYAPQSKIYPAILTELQDAAAQINLNGAGMVGDVIYGGDMAAWKKFANSLRLRIALKIKEVDAATADSHIADAMAGDVFTSNDDNAMFTYESSDVNASPFYRAFNVDNRKDFAISHSFVQLLKGDNIVDPDGNDLTDNPFSGMADPRLAEFAQQNSDGAYVGMPIVESSAEAGAYVWESLPGSDIIDNPAFSQTLMDFAEVSFILSELNGWDQTHYENGVRAAMEKWGVASADIDSYVATLPAASEENVLTQKYIALYMSPHTAWQEYRRTGYPKTILKPGDSYTVVPADGVEQSFQFTSLVDGVTDLPNRLQYPDFERTLNGENRSSAVSALQNGDALNSPLWWDR